MIIRATKKTIIKIKKKEYDCIEEKESIPLNEWYVNHFLLNRKGYFIITEAKSLYSIINESIGINREESFNKLLGEVFRNFEKTYGLLENTIDTTVVRIVKTNNRSILGSQNDLIHMAESLAYYEDIYKEFIQINETPMMYTHSFPNKDIKVEIEKRKNF